MQINGGVRFCEGGMQSAIRAMQVQQAKLSMINENIMGFDKVGFQRREIVTSAATEYQGVNGLSTTIDDQVGRIVQTSNPLDIAMSNKGYFQVQTPYGVKLTRDGRFKLDKDGYIKTVEDFNVLSDAGLPIKLPVIPENIDKVIVDSKGKVSVYDEKTNKYSEAGYFGIVDATGMAVLDPGMKQRCSEFSNVALHNEFFRVKPVVNNFDANRQIFIIESNNLQKVISQLGSVS